MSSVNTALLLTFFPMEAFSLASSSGRQCCWGGGQDTDMGRGTTVTPVRLVVRGGGCLAVRDWAWLSVSLCALQAAQGQGLSICSPCVHQAGLTLHTCGKRSWQPGGCSQPWGPISKLQGRKSHILTFHYTSLPQPELLRIFH